jgi:hypothetical protein
MDKHHHIGRIIFKDRSMKIEIDGAEREFDLSEVSEALLRASETERMIYEISPSGYGIHWTLIDEDLSVDGLLGIVHQPEFIRLAA